MADSVLQLDSAEKDDCAEPKAFNRYPDRFSVLPFDFYEGNIQANFTALEYMPIHLFGGSNGADVLLP